MLPKKQLSGAQQRKKSKHDDKLAESQRGALHKFFVSSSTVDVNEVQAKGRNIEKDILDNTDLDTIINDFASRNVRKILFVKDWNINVDGVRS